MSMRRTLWGAALGMKIGSMSGEPARAADAHVEQAAQVGFSFDELSKDLGSYENAHKLLNHFEDWVHRPEAWDVARRLATQHPGMILEVYRVFLEADISWGKEIVLAALQSPDLNELQLSTANLNYDDPTVYSLVEASMQHNHALFFYTLCEHTLPAQVTGNIRRLFVEALRATSTDHPSDVLGSFLMESYMDQAFPDPAEREELITPAVMNIIYAEHGNDFASLAALASRFPEVKRIIAHHYGWDKFIEKCEEVAPIFAVDQFESTGKIFGHYASLATLVYLAEEAADRDPVGLASRSRVFEDLRNVTPLAHYKIRQSVDHALYIAITEHPHDVLSSNTVMREGTGYSVEIDQHLLETYWSVGQALSEVAVRDPLSILQYRYYDQTSPPDCMLRWRVEAAPALLSQHIWRDASHVYTLPLLAGLPQESHLAQEWFAGAMRDVSGVDLLQLLETRYPHETWSASVRDEIEFYYVDWRQEHPYGTADSLLEANLNYLSGFARDNFLSAAQAASDFAENHPENAYAALYYLEQAQPYEFDAWVKSDAAKYAIAQWRGLVADARWQGLSQHAAAIGADDSYRQKATSLAVRGTRFDAAAMQTIAGMNYQHRLKTLVAGSPTEQAFPGTNFVTIPMSAFETIATSPQFAAYIDAHVQDRMTFVDLCSVAQITFRRMRDLHLAVSPENIARALQDVDAQWERVKNLEIFGPHTQLIVVANKEERFGNERLRQLALSHGSKPQQVLFEGKDAADKNRDLEAIARAKHDPLTIVFNGHGGSGNLWLDTKSTISYTELADALIKSQNINLTRLILDDCYGYDFSHNLLQYLRDQGADVTDLVIITAANQNSLGFGPDDERDLSTLLSAVEQHAAAGQPITLDTFRQAQADIWDYEDPSITVGLPLDDSRVTAIEVANR